MNSALGREAVNRIMLNRVAVEAAGIKTGAIEVVAGCMTISSAAGVPAFTVMVAGVKVSIDIPQA
jgi:hypothetical protein